MRRESTAADSSGLGRVFSDDEALKLRQPLSQGIDVALRQIQFAALDHAPETVALGFLNNLAFGLGQRPFWQHGYYAGTFGEYSMAAVRSSRRKSEEWDE